MRAYLLLPLALTLAACSPKGVQPPASYDLSGTVGGDWGATPRLRLALIGTGLPGVVTNTSQLSQTVVPQSGGWQYGVDLPNVPSILGAYQVVVFDDADNNGNFDAGETFARNRRYLIFSPATRHFGEVKVPEFLPKAGETMFPAMDLTQGWNVYDPTQPLGSVNPAPLTKLTGYDLSR